MVFSKKSCTKLIKICSKSTLVRIFHFVCLIYFGKRNFHLRIFHCDKFALENSTSIPIYDLITPNQIPLLSSKNYSQNSQRITFKQKPNVR